MVLLVLGALLIQVLIPITADSVGDQYPEVAHLTTPYSLAAIVAIACVQVALGAVWVLLSMTTSDQIFSSPALKWVDVIVVCAAIGTLLSATVFVHLIFIVGLGGPGAFLGLAACVAVGAALVLVIVVMRSLLETAIAHRYELAEVI